MKDVYWFRAGNNRTETEMPRGYCLQQVYDRANELARLWGCETEAIRFGLVSIANDESED